MKLKPDPGRHALLIAVESYDASVKSPSRGLEGTAFKPLSTPCTDAKIMEQELVNLAFKVRRQEDMTAVGISKCIDKFAHEACKRQTDGTLPDTTAETGQYKQVLLLYFSGHGVRMHGQQFAVGSDSSVANVNKRFVQALKSKLSNCSIILLMDACGDAVHAEAAEDAMHLQHLVKGVNGNEDNLNGNLIVCAYACQVGQKAYEGLYCSDWTEEIAKNLKTPVDIKLMLLNAQDAFRDKQQWPLIEVRPRRKKRSRFTLSKSEEEFIAKPIPGTCMKFRDTGDYTVEETSILRQFMPGQEPLIERRVRTLPRKLLSDDGSGGGTRTCSTVLADELDLSFSKSPRCMHLQQSRVLYTAAHTVQELDVTSRTGSAPVPGVGLEGDSESDQRNTSFQGERTGVEVPQEDVYGRVLARRMKRKQLFLLVGYVLLTLAGLWGTVALIIRWNPLPASDSPDDGKEREGTKDRAGSGLDEIECLESISPTLPPEARFVLNSNADAPSSEPLVPPFTQEETKVNCTWDIGQRECQLGHERLGLAEGYDAWVNSTEAFNMCSGKQVGSNKGAVPAAHRCSEFPGSCMEVAFNTPHRTTICAPKTFMFVSVPQLTSVNDSYTLCNNNTSTAAGPSSCGVVREAWHRGWTGCVGCGLFEHSLFVGRDVCAAHQTASGCEDAIAGSLWMAPTTLGTGRGCSHDAGAPEYQGQIFVVVVLAFISCGAVLLLVSIGACIALWRHRQVCLARLRCKHQQELAKMKTARPHYHHSPGSMICQMESVTADKPTLGCCQHASPMRRPLVVAPASYTTPSAATASMSMLTEEREVAVPLAFAGPVNGSVQGEHALAPTAIDELHPEIQPVAIQREHGDLEEPVHAADHAAPWLQPQQPLWSPHGDSLCRHSHLAPVASAHAQHAAVELQDSTCTSELADVTAGDRREAVLAMMKSLAAQHCLLNNRFVLMNRALHVGGQGCVYLAVDKERDHERVVVKTFFCHAHFWTEAALYIDDDVISENILPHRTFGVGAWIEDPGSDVDGAANPQAVAMQAVASGSSTDLNSEHLMESNLRDLVTANGKQKASSIPYIVMKAGVTLKQCVQVTQGLTVQRYVQHFKPLQVIRDLALLLSRLHRLGFVHRDLKPSNIIDISDDPGERNWRLIDVASHATEGQTVHPVVSVCYAAPETMQFFATGSQAIVADGVDMQAAAVSPEAAAREAIAGIPHQRTQIATAALDIWSLGVIAIELLTSVNTLEPLSSKRVALLAATGSRAYPWESRVGVFDRENIDVLAGLPDQSVREIVEACLSRDVSRRPTAEQVVNKLT